MSRIHNGARRAPAITSPALTIQQRDALILKKLANRGAFTQEVDTLQLTTKRRPGTVGKTNAAVLIGGGIAGLAAAVPLIFFIGPLAGGGIAAAGVAITLGATTLMPRGTPRPASMRKHIFADLGIVHTREESADLTRQLGKELHLITPGKERFVLPGWDSKRIKQAKVNGQPVSNMQRHAIKVVLKQTELQQQLLKQNLPANKKALGHDFKHFWHMATLSRSYNTVVQTWFMNWKLKRVAKKQQKARLIKA